MYGCHQFAEECDWCACQECAGMLGGTGGQGKPQTVAKPQVPGKPQKQKPAQPPPQEEMDQESLKKGAALIQQGAVKDAAAKKGDAVSIAPAIALYREGIGLLEKAIATAGPEMQSKLSGKKAEVLNRVHALEDDLQKRAQVDKAGATAAAAAPAAAKPQMPSKPKKKAAAAAAPAAKPVRACEACEGQLLRYDSMHPLYSEVGEIPEWQCDGCERVLGASDPLYGCHQFAEECDWCACQECAGMLGASRNEGPGAALLLP